MSEDTDISKEIEELEKIIDEISDKVPEHVEEKISQWKDDFNKKYCGNKEALAKLLNYVQEKTSKFREDRLKNKKN